MSFTPSHLQSLALWVPASCTRQRTNHAHLLTKSCSILNLNDQLFIVVIADVPQLWLANRIPSWVLHWVHVFLLDNTSLIWHHWSSQCLFVLWSRCWECTAVNKCSWKPFIFHVFIRQISVIFTFQNIMQLFWRFSIIACKINIPMMLGSHSLFTLHVWILKDISKQTVTWVWSAFSFNLHLVFSCFVVLC